MFLPQNVRVAALLINSDPKRPPEAHDMATPPTGRGYHLPNGHLLHAWQLRLIVKVAEATSQESRRDPNRFSGVNHERTLRS